MEEKNYCIYSNQFLPKERLNIEHIIPKSLGGSDDFTILVDKQKNSILGSEVDGQYVNDPLVKLKLIHTNHKGHSKKEQELHLKKSSINNNPVSLKFRKSGIDIYDPIAKKHIYPSGESIKTSMTINRETRIKFIAKVALATGYFILGENFVKYADHETLRKFIFSPKVLNSNFDLKFIDSLLKIQEKDKTQVQLNSLLISHLGGTNVIFQICQTNIIVEIGIDGEYIGGVNFKANGNNIPYYDDIRLGQVVNINNGVMKCISYWRALYEMNNAMNIVTIDDSQLDK